MKIFRALLGVWLVFVGVVMTKMIQSIQPNWDIAIGSFMALVGVWLVNQSLDTQTKRRKS